MYETIEVWKTEVLINLTNQANMYISFKILVLYLFGLSHTLSEQ